MSKGLRKGLIALLLIAAAVYVGAKLYARSQADAALSEASYALRDVVRLSYEGFSAGLDGTLTIHELTLRPAKGSGELFIRRLDVSAGSLPAALSVRRHLSAGRLPAALTLTAEDVRLNLDSPLYRRLAEWSGGFVVGTPVDHLACGEASATNAAVLEAMGYSYISAHVDARWRRGRDDRAALVSARIEAEDIARIDAEGVVRSPDDALNLETLRTGAVNLGDVDLRYRDKGYFDARNYYCAAQRDSDVDDFLAAHRAAVAEYLGQHGAVPTQAALDAYLRLIGSPGNELHIGLSPTEPVLLNELPGLDPQQLTQRLHPTWAVNGDGVETVVARWVAPSSETVRPDTGNGQNGQARYYAADPAMLDQLAGSFARIVTYDGTTHKGIIEEASGSRLTMQRRFQGGDMSFGVALGDIETVEIYRREPLPPELQPKPEPEEETATVIVSPEAEDAGPSAPQAGAKAPTETTESTPREDAERAGAMTAPDLDELEPRPASEPAEKDESDKPPASGESDP